MSPTTTDSVSKHAYQNYNQLFIVSQSYNIYKEWLESIVYFKGEHVQTQIELRKG